MRNNRKVFLVLVVATVLFCLMGSTLSAQEVEVFPIQTSSYWRFERISGRLIFWQRIGGLVTVYQLPGMEQVDRFVPGIAWVISVQYSPFSNKYYVLGGSESANAADTLLVFDVSGGNNRRAVQSFPLARTGFHPLYVDSRSGFAFYGRPFLASEPERKFLILNLANGQLEGEVEATPLQKSYWTAFDEETQRLVFPKITSDGNLLDRLDGVYVYSSSQLKIEKFLELPAGTRGNFFPGSSNNDFDGKRIAVPATTGYSVIDLDGTVLYKRGKSWNDTHLAIALNLPLAVSYLAILNSQGFLTGIQAYGIHDLSLGIPMYMFPPGEARVDFQAGESSHGLFVHDNTTYHITSTKLAKITLPTYDRLDKELIFPFVRQTANGSEWTGLAVSSPDANHLASAEIRNRDGNLMPGVINPVLLNFAGSPQIARFSQEWFGDDILKQTLNNTQVIVVRYNSSRKLKGFGLYGNSDLTFLDGFLALSPDKAGREIVMPTWDGSHQDWNSGDRWTAFHITAGTKAEVRSREFDLNGSSSNGTGWGERNAFQVASEPFSTAAKRYVRVESSEPLLGVSFIGKPGEDKAGFQAQPLTARKKKLTFTQNATGFGVWRTELVLINAFLKTEIPQAQTVILKLHKNDGSVLRETSRSIAGNGMLWEDTFSLFGINDVTGYVTGEAMGKGLLGWIRFQAWQLASALPAQEPSEVVVFSHVAQVAPQGNLPGWGQGVTVLNPGSQTVEVKAEVFKPNGEKTGENTFSLNPGEKRAQHLNESMFFGPGFQQAGGFVRLTVLTPGGKIVAFSLFYASNGRVMAAVPGH